MLELIDLWAEVGGTSILKGLSLTIKPGEVHAIMGPNAAGKSTLSKVITGHPDYTITKGDILLNGVSLKDMEPEERAHLGIFLSFQHPVEIPGVASSVFLKAAVNATRKARGLEEYDAATFLRKAREQLKLVEMDSSLLKRSLNVGFSGGEKKRMEVFQLAMLEPTVAILDEPDSGLDVDALRIVAAGVNQLRNDKRSFLVITHYQRLLDHLVPDFTHILMDGRIVQSGDASLALKVETGGYGWVEAAS